ncbi:hypothetical protein R6Q59_035682 [Mikania micrantha]
MELIRLQVLSYDGLHFLDSLAVTAAELQCSEEKGSSIFCRSSEACAAASCQIC